jgi:hypothetical protein
MVTVEGRLQHEKFDDIFPIILKDSKHSFEN